MSEKGGLRVDVDNATNSILCSKEVGETLEAYCINGMTAWMIEARIDYRNWIIIVTSTSLNDPDEIAKL